MKRKVKRKWHDPWAEYGKPTTFSGVALECDPTSEARKIPSIEELERILNSEEELMIEILPNGSIAARQYTDGERGNRKPLTMRENLGGEY